jgi:UDP-N-acetylglucosamine acyltransferase
VGTLAMMQGGAMVSLDVPPFTIVPTGVNRLCGLNAIGLRRSGMTAAERMEVKKLYLLLFRSGRNLPEVMAEAQTSFKGAAAKLMLDFLAGAKRGVCSDVKVHRPSRLEDIEED